MGNIHINSVNMGCKGCSDRYVGCHATCNKYLLYKANLDVRKQMEKNNYTPTIRQSDFVGTAIHRNRHTNRQIAQYMESKHHA